MARDLGQSRMRDAKNTKGEDVPMAIRELDLERDREAMHRIWQEVGWISSEQDELEGMDIFVGAADALVADVAGSAECLALSHSGTLRYQDVDLPFCAVTGVTTSHVARRQGFARRLAARLLARGAERGDLVAGLGIFDQGFYDQLGFGCGAYEHSISFDPSQLMVDPQTRPPRRIGKEDWEEIHRARLGRWRRHGAVSLLPAEVSRAELAWAKKGFGLGYPGRDGAALGHLFWASNEGGEHGPFRIDWLAYENREQFLELMSLLRGLGDQVYGVRLTEPPGIQMQDLLSQPFKQRRITDQGRFAQGMRASSWHQSRILNLARCVSALSVPGDPVSFNLRVTDPIAEYLEGDAGWSGVAGDYVVTLGEESQAVKGHKPALPELEAGVKAFTRLWMGVLPATGLAVTDDLRGPDDLLQRLDRALRLPLPKVDWSF